MLIGHFAPFALGRVVAPRLSLLVLFTATYFADLLEFSMLVAGVHPVSAAQHSHSFPLVAAGGAACAAIAAERFHFSRRHFLEKY